MLDAPPGLTPVPRLACVDSAHLRGLSTLSFHTWVLRYRPIYRSMLQPNTPTCVRSVFAEANPNAMSKLGDLPEASVCLPRDLVRFRFPTLTSSSASSYRAARAVCRGQGGTWRRCGNGHRRCGFTRTAVSFFDALLSVTTIAAPLRPTDPQPLWTDSAATSLGAQSEDVTDFFAVFRHQTSDHPSSRPTRWTIGRRARHQRHISTSSF